MHFIVPAIPVAQPRPKATTVNGRARMYEAKKSHPIHAFKASVRLSAKQEYDGAPLEGPLRLCVRFRLPRPQSMVWKTKPMPRVWHDNRLDCDNLLKAVQDALNGLMYRDDSQIACVAVTKEYAAGDEQPHVELTLDQLG